MKTHNEFVEDVKHFSSLPSKTCRALAPDSQEDVAMYNNLTKEERDAVDEVGRLGEHDALMEDSE